MVFDSPEWSACYPASMHARLDQTAAAPRPTPRPSGASAIRAALQAPYDCDFPDVRVPVHEAEFATMSLVSRSAPNAPAAGFAEADHLALPLGGVFLWRVGAGATAIDANRVLYISAGQEYSESHPIRNRGHASAVVEPNAETFDELRRTSAAHAGARFRTVTAAASPRAQLLTCRLVHANRTALGLAGDELVLALLDELLATAPTDTGHTARRLVTRAKQLVHEWLGRRFSLADVARQVGVTPVYLTTVFRQVEGMPLYRYHNRVRLAHALNRLPGAECLTSLALDLGYSSHSHFSAAFRAQFGVTPSRFRAEQGAGSAAR